MSVFLEAVVRQTNHHANSQPYLARNGEEDLLQAGEADLDVSDAQLAALRLEPPQERRQLRLQRSGHQELDVRLGLVGRVQAEPLPAQDGQTFYSEDTSPVKVRYMQASPIRFSHESPNMHPPLLSCSRLS